jgi:hypothetical protein
VIREVEQGISLCERIATKLGWGTDYYIVCQTTDGQSKHIGSGIYKVYPWISAANYNLVKSRVAESHGYDSGSFVITFIAKL